MTRPLRAAALALGLTATALAVPTAASAAEYGTTTIQLGGAAARSLKAAGVTVGAAKPATLRRGLIELPVTGGSVGTTARLRHSGGLTLRAKRGGTTRTLKLTACRWTSTGPSPP